MAPTMALLTRSRVILVLVVLALAAAVLTYKVATYDAPNPVTPLVRPDGSYRTGSIPGDGAGAVSAAVAALPVALSYDYRSLDKSLAAATAAMTPTFARQFTTIFDKTTRSMATEKKAITSALVRAAGIVGAVKGGKAQVLIYLDQVLVSSATKKANEPLSVNQNRVEVTLRRTEGKWKVDGIEPF